MVPSVSLFQPILLVAWFSRIDTKCPLLSMEQCLPMGPMMVLYQYLNRQLISNDYTIAIFNDVFVYTCTLSKY